jgi:uncharacterized membrane protein
VLDRFILGAAIVGLVVSAYLAVVDLSGGSALCIVGSDCDVVRASTYSQLIGLPLTGLGISYFAAVIAATLLQTSWQPRLLQFLGGVGLGAAIVFVGLQALVLRAWCPYCIVADAAAVAIGLRALWPRPNSRRGATLRRGVAGAALAVAVLLIGYAAAPTTAAERAATGTTDGGAASSTMSADRLAALADHLRESGATLYGAYWCPHCQEQKQAFGAAAGRLPYVECDPRGTNAQPAACQAAGVRAYPTWIIDGQKIEGEIPPSELGRLSGFES